MKSLLAKLNLQDINPGACYGPDGWLSDPNGKELVSYNPTTGEKIASVLQATSDTFAQVMTQADAAFKVWREVPAPKRGQVVRDLGDLLREHKEPLGDLVSLEMGKIKAEGHGEVQEMIDICDFAVGQSRMLYGLTIQSERPYHRLMEQWQPLGVVAVISAFNFPVAVWSWNAFLAAICGNVTVWKPSPKTALCAVAVQHLKQEPEPLEKIRGDLPPLLCRIIHKMMAKDPEKRSAAAPNRALSAARMSLTRVNTMVRAAPNAGSRGRTPRSRSRQGGAVSACRPLRGRG